VCLGRSEVEGVVQEAFASGGVPAARHLAVTIRGAYHARNNAELEQCSTPNTTTSSVSTADVEAGLPVIRMGI
jgi:hypothetical protein